ncbi:MAG TPA: hypothetical protein VLB29_20145 [Nocardioidaceae bacterium]|nr:hypothetical protein [Nocardioidaceae bacterium]
MSDYMEQPDPRAESEETRPTSRHDVELTGDEAVDGVLRSLENLEGTRVQEHVAVFESAHETLRAALADAGDRPGGPAAG